MGGPVPSTPLEPRWRRVCAALAAALVLTLAAGARGDREAAKQLFRAGRAAYERGDYRAAAASFEQAARSEPHGQAWYAAGDAWANAGVADRAVYAFEQAVALGGLPPGDLRKVERRTAVLVKKLGVVEIRGPAGTVVAVGHVARAELPARIHLRPGEHSIRLIEPAHAATSRVAQVEVGETALVTFEVAPLPSPEPADPTPEPAPPPPVPPVEEEPTAATGVAGWVLVGLGVPTAAVAAVITTVALDARDEWEADRRDTELRDRAETLRTVTGVTWVAAGVLLGAGATLLIVDATSGGDEPGAELSLRLGLQGATLGGRW